MRLGIKVKLTITDSGALRNEGWVKTERSMTDDESIALLFAHPSASKSFKVMAVDVQGSGTERNVRIVANVLNKDDLIRDAIEKAISIGSCDSVITTPYIAFRELAVANNHHTCRQLIGVSFDDGVQMNNSDIRRVLERSSEHNLSH